MHEPSPPNWMINLDTFVNLETIFMILKAYFCRLGYFEF
jgi:hypothetical protein